MSVACSTSCSPADDIIIETSENAINMPLNKLVKAKLNRALLELQRI